MLFVWLRTVLTPTTSSRAMPGPSSSVASSRSTSSSRWLSGSTRPCPVSVRSSVLASAPNRRREDPTAVPRPIPKALVCDGLQHHGFDEAANSPGCLGRSLETLQQHQRATRGLFVLVALPARHEHPGEDEMLELAQVAQIVVDREPALGDPRHGIGESALSDPEAGPGRRHRAPLPGEILYRLARP